MGYMSNTAKFVIKVENKQPVDNPVAYDNFLMVFNGCPRQETPTNDVIGPYGYEVFEFTMQPQPGMFEHPAELLGYVKRGDVWTQNWVSVPFTEEEIQHRTEIEYKILKRKRNVYLQFTDWTQLPDVQLSDEVKLQWAEYRQQLRDLPANTTDPFNPVWPTTPVPIDLPQFPPIPPKYLINV